MSFLKVSPCLRRGHLEVVQVCATRAAMQSDHGGLERVVLVIGNVSLAGVNLSQKAKNFTLKVVIDNSLVIYTTITSHKFGFFLVTKKKKAFVANWN